MNNKLCWNTWLQRSDNCYQLCLVFASWEPRSSSVGWLCPKVSSEHVVRLPSQGLSPLPHSLMWLAGEHLSPMDFREQADCPHDTAAGFPCSNWCKRESHSVFYDLVSQVSCRHFCFILFSIFILFLTNIKSVMVISSHLLCKSSKECSDIGNH